jgi:hypothetical protein
VVRDMCGEADVICCEDDVEKSRSQEVGRYRVYRKNYGLPAMKMPGFRDAPAAEPLV